MFITVFIIRWLYCHVLFILGSFSDPKVFFKNLHVVIIFERQVRKISIDLLCQVRQLIFEFSLFFTNKLIEQPCYFYLDINRHVHSEIINIFKVSYNSRIH